MSDPPPIDGATPDGTAPDGAAPDGATPDGAATTRAAEPFASLPVALALAVVAGAGWALAVPPHGWWPLLPFGVAALGLALDGRRFRERLLVGVVTGAVYYFGALVWLARFAVPGYLAVALLETGLLAGALTLVPPDRRGQRWRRGWWVLPAVLVLLESVQARVPFGGFPLVSLALSQIDGPFAGAAPVGGSLLVTALAAVGGVGIAAVVTAARRGEGLRTGQSWRRAGLVTAGVVAVAGAVAVGKAGVAAGSTEPAGVLDVAVVQGGGVRGLPAVRSDPQATTDRQLAVAGRITGSPDLVLLPENVITVAGPVAGSDADARLAALARALDAAVVAGVVETAGPTFRNAAVLWGPDGRRLDRYDKQHRVPFGEYIPARGLLERVTDLTALVPRDAEVGRGDALLEPPAGPLGVAISYEVLFPDRVRDGVLAGGRLVLVPTNTASYVTEQVPAIEVAAARLRAREFGRTVLQAAPTGYSVVILPSGRVAAQSGLEVPALLRERVPLRTGLTPYARTGDVPIIAAATVILLIPALTRIARSHRRPQS